MEQRISFLLQQRLEQKLTPAEAQELLSILQNAGYDEIVTDVLQEMAASGEQGPAFDPVILQKWVHGIVSVDKKAAGGVDPAKSVTPVRRIPFLSTVWFRYAAVILLLAGAGGWLFYHSRVRKEDSTPQELSKGPDIAPGGNKAILTLSDGSTIVLDSAANGVLSQQGNTKITKSASGQLAYQTAESVKPLAASPDAYNTISTPRGGQYQVQLPDGSKVWLNASSSLHFPTVFRGKSRTVEITGEVYFEIAKDANKPFYVKVNGLSVEVLGTQFNVNAYADEPVIKTTLLEGSVRVSKDNSVAMLMPGQQAQVVNGQIKVVKDADLEEAMAWKNGLFHLASADVGTIMRQLARWYDVEVDFEGGIPSGHITGEVPRNTSLSKVLKVFETSGVHFRVEGKKIFVTP
ncbi:MAG TPA: FecR domain-containing protein [Puia sp.]|nr:FecR domain-containing protein [Puia sp.]